MLDKCACMEYIVDLSLLRISQANEVLDQVIASGEGDVAIDGDADAEKTDNYIEMVPIWITARLEFWNKSDLILLKRKKSIFFFHDLTMCFPFPSLLLRGGGGGLLDV